MYLDGLLGGLSGMVNVLHPPELAVQLQREGGDVADGVHVGDAGLEEGVRLRAKRC